MFWQRQNTCSVAATCNSSKSRNQQMWIQCTSGTEPPLHPYKTGLTRVRMLVLCVCVCVMFQVARKHFTLELLSLSTTRTHGTMGWWEYTTAHSTHTHHARRKTGGRHLSLPVIHQKTTSLCYHWCSSLLSIIDTPFAMLKGEQMFIEHIEKYIFMQSGFNVRRGWTEMAYRKRCSFLSQLELYTPKKVCAH